MLKKFFPLSFLVTFLVIPFVVSAHQPNIVSNKWTEVKDPEISKAYYAELRSDSMIYHYKGNPIKLYVGLLVPDLPNQSKDFSIIIQKTTNGVSEGARSDFNDQSNWEKMHEPFAGDEYLSALEYRLDAVSEFTITVFSDKTQNQGKYVLAIGETESFPPGEMLRTIGAVVELKKNFFNTSPIDFANSIIGGSFLALTIIIGLLIGLILWLIFKRKKNLNITERIVRLIIGLGLIGWMIATIWNAIILILAGFIISESISGWCILKKFYVKKK